MWARLLSALLGIWLMIAPAILNYDYPAIYNDRIVGPLVTSIAIISMWQVTRPLRWLNLLIGLWLVTAPWLLDYDDTASLYNSVVVGIALIGLASIRGRSTKHYGGGWASLLKPDMQRQGQPEGRQKTS